MAIGGSVKEDKRGEYFVNKTGNNKMQTQKKIY